MTAVQALRKEASPPPQRSPERQALADAIGKREAAEQLCNKVAAALEKADATSAATFRAVKQAKVALEEAQQNERQHLAAVALGEADAGISPAAAQSALSKAQVAYDDASKLVEALKAEHEQAEQRLPWAAQGVNDAASAVLRTAPEVQQLLADFDVAKRATASVASKLTALMRAGAVDEVNWDLRAYQPDRHADATWQAAIERLRSDPDAPLPTA